MIADETDGLILALSPSSGILTAMNEARENVVFDVLSHNSKDKPAGRALAALLADRGIKVRPGIPLKNPPHSMISPTRQRSGRRSREPLTPHY